MPRADLDLHFNRIELLVTEMDSFVPISLSGSTQFRADLAGLLVVTMAASYETCVKETMVSHASKHHIAFGKFTLNNYNKLNSKVALGDLYRYATLFDDAVSAKFKAALAKRKKVINDRIGKNIERSYQQILDWRHAFAHAGIRSATIEEAISTHRLAKRVLYSFDEAFN